MNFTISEAVQELLTNNHQGLTTLTELVFALYERGIILVDMKEGKPRQYDLVLGSSSTYAVLSPRDFHSESLEDVPPLKYIRL